MKVIQPIKTHKLKIIASITLLILCLTLYNICKIPITTSAESYGTALSVQDDTYLNVAIPNSVVLNITPTAAGQFAKTSMDISVDTNNATGYTLTMTADTTSLSRTSAVNGVDYSIPTLSSATTCTDESDTTCDTFPVGYWGYKFTNAEIASSSTYNPISTDVTKLRFQKDFNSSVDTTTVTFGTKLSNSIPNGTYDGVNFTFIATTNYVIPETVKYMQDFNAVIADSLTPGIAYTTKDSRDNQDYTIAKLTDGYIWMLDNLRLGAVDLVQPLSVSNTNMASDVTLNYNNKVFSLPSSSTTCFTPSSCTASDSDHKTGTGYTVPAINTDQALSNATYPQSYTGPVGKYGTLYNYCAVTAGTYCYAREGGLNVKINYDICPAGWSLPIQGYYRVPGTYEYLESTEDIVNILRMPLGGVMTYDTLDFKNQGQYWRRFYVDGNKMGIYLVGETALSSGRQERFVGMYARCIKDRSMQNFSATDAAAMSEGQTITLVDSRDNKEYKVTKINGRVWMTQNLAFTGTTLTPADSNVSTNATIEWNDLASDGESGSKCDTNNGFNNACNIISTNNAQGVWYNYAAASAMTITGATNSTRDTYSICPKGWQLPDSYTTLTDGFSGDSALFPQVYGGWRYPGGGEESNGNAFYWTRSNASPINRYLIGVAPNANAYGTNTNRTNGCYIRCIFSGE
ncbi:hypothetical protein IKG68_00600 [Candidatus Saccharibacteria bacterium]|nr:hypothetical protein [Candidatus Saccharibacteria bacterium]